MISCGVNLTLGCFPGMPAKDTSSMPPWLVARQWLHSPLGNASACKTAYHIGTGKLLLQHLPPQGRRSNKPCTVRKWPWHSGCGSLASLSSSRGGHHSLQLTAPPGSSKAEGRLPSWLVQGKSTLKSCLIHNMRIF